MGKRYKAIIDEYFAWKVAMEKLTTEKMVGYINYILENNKANIETKLINSLIVNFYGENYDNHEFTPLRQEQVKEALRLTQDSMI